MFRAKTVLPSMAALQCFEAVAPHMSFTLAANDVFLTQGAVSKQIAQLESQLRQAIVSPARPRGLSLTPAGRMYLSEVRQILHQVRCCIAVCDGVRQS